jgi:hypothetical protein
MDLERAATIMWLVGGSGRGTGGYGHFQRDSDTGFGTCAVTPGEYVVKRFAVG